MFGLDHSWIRQNWLKFPKTAAPFVGKASGWVLKEFVALSSFQGWLSLSLSSIKLSDQLKIRPVRRSCDLQKCHNCHKIRFIAFQNDGILLLATKIWRPHKRFLEWKGENKITISIQSLSFQKFELRIGERFGLIFGRDDATRLERGPGRLNYS